MRRRLRTLDDLPVAKVGTRVNRKHLNKQVLLYGLIGGLLIALLKAVEYRFLVVEYSVEIYGGIIAAIFAGLGVWLGLRFTRPAPAAQAAQPAVTMVAPRADVPFVRDAA